jgi:hypothetical protein
VQVGRTQRDTGDGVEYFSGSTGLKHAIVAGQQQRRFVVAGGEDEDRWTERGDGLETGRGGCRNADREANAKALTFPLA